MGCQNSIECSAPVSQKYQFSPELFVKSTVNPQQSSPISSKSKNHTIIDTSIKHYQQFLQNNALSNQPFDGLGCIEDQVGYFQGRTEQWYRSGREKGIIQGNPYDALSICYSIGGSLEEAEAWYSRMISQRPGGYQLYMGMGNIFYRKGQFKQAEQCYKKAIDLNPRLDRAYLNIAYIYCYHLHDNGKAFEWASFALKINKKNEHAGLIRQTVRQNAELKMTGLLNLHLKYPDYIRVHNAIGLLYLEKNQIDEAISWFKNGIEKNPQFQSLRCGLAIAYNLKGNSDAAIKLSQESITINPSCHEPYITLGQAYAAKGQLLEAEKWYQKCIDMNPNLKLAFLELARLYLKQQRRDQAMKLLQRADITGEVLLELGQDYLPEMGLDVSSFEPSHGELNGKGDSSEEKAYVPNHLVYN